MSARWHILVVVVVLLVACGSDCRADERYFNAYIIRAYAKVRQNHEAKYNLHAWYSKNLDYGDEKGAIKARNPPYTMCNAAVTEVLIEAINIYAAEHRNWSAAKIIPASSWQSAQWSQLMPHLFSQDFRGYPPLEDVIEAHIKIEKGLGKDIDNFQSEHGMSIALEKFGLGESIQFQDARPGERHQL